MRSALYYPHTELGSIDLLKTSMLLWDKIAYIVPDPSFRPDYEDKLVAEAMELIGEKHYPSDDEKQQAHELIEEFVTSNIPAPFFFRDTERNRRQAYEIYPQKFMPETWRLLRESQLAGSPLANMDVPLSEQTGLAVMSILADCCAGKTRARITDRSAAYATVMSMLRSEKIDGEAGQALEQLVPISLTVLNTDVIPLKPLLELRKKEEGRGGHVMRRLRHRYVDRLSEYAKQLGEPGLRATDQKERMRQFKSDMKDDYAALKSELGGEGRNLLFSKEVYAAAIGVAVAGGVAIATGTLPPEVKNVAMWAGPAASIWGTLGAGNKFIAGRRSVLEKYPMAYIYQLNRAL